MQIETTSAKSAATMKINLVLRDCIYLRQRFNSAPNRRLGRGWLGGGGAWRAFGALWFGSFSRSNQFSSIFHSSSSSENLTFARFLPSSVGIVKRTMAEDLPSGVSVTGSEPSMVSIW